MFRSSLVWMGLLACGAGSVAQAALPLHADEAALAYYGDFLVHPGLSARTGWELGASERGQVLLEAQIGGFWHRHDVVALSARAGPAVRWTTRGGTSLGAFAHVGVQQGFWATRTYAVVDGEVRGATLAGDQWVVGAAGAELGHTLRSEALDAWFVRPQLGLRLPTFHGYGVDLAVEAGVRF